MLPLDTSGSKNGVQAVGSTVSYGKRYAICALLNISTGDDTDGNIPHVNQSKPEVVREKLPISDSKLADVVNRIKNGEATIGRLLNNHTLTDGQKNVIKTEFPQVQL